MKQFLITVAGVLVGLVLFLVVAPIVVVSLLVSSASKAPAAPSKMVIALDLREELTDQRSQNPFASLGDGANILDIVTKLDAAGRDDRVKGVFVRAATSGLAPAHAEEIRDALRRFRSHGKFVVAHAQNEDVRMSMPGYVAVADADEFWLQGVSEFMPMGLSAEMSFLGGTLARYRIQLQAEAREEYKNALNTLMEEGFTPAHREATEGLLNNLYAIMLRHIAEDRGITVEAARAAIEATPMTSERAIELKLIDKLGSPEAAEAAALARGGQGAEMIQLSAYTPPSGSGPVIAVVLGEGEIYSGTSENSPFGESGAMLGDDISQALLDASEAKDVRAIVFRVSSPGGTIAASDQILAALRTARERGKKVVVSMGSMAASGGYYVSAEADEIVANPTTLTGSIGVFGAKVVLGPALQHYFSVRSDRISVGSPQIAMFSPNEPFTPAGRQAFAGFITRSYEEFMGRVAAGRHLTRDQVHASARGRVWTGEQAKERRLVDHLGGFDTALVRARALADLRPDQRVTLRYYPSQKSPFEALSALFGASTETARAAVLLGAVLGDERVSELLNAARSNAAVRAREALQVE
ncbi:MAG: S49 family peptidase [Hyphomonadaceae bacterium]|nr:S49 family peptidase [Hyphomonadaceae bacterium]